MSTEEQYNAVIEGGVAPAKTTSDRKGLIVVDKEVVEGSFKHLSETDDTTITSTKKIEKAFEYETIFNPLGKTIGFACVNVTFKEIV